MNKKTSTITKKPQVDPIESWINGSNQNAPANPSPASETAGQQASRPASMPTTVEATRMLSVRIPADLHQKLRIHAVSQSLQIQDIVTTLLQGYLAEEQPSP
jgi:head-tail adaptor